MNRAAMRARRNVSFVRAWNMICDYVADQNLDIDQSILDHKLHMYFPTENVLKLRIMLDEMDCMEVFMCRYNSYCKGLRGKIFQKIVIPFSVL
jgi:hypothetical protein